MIKYGRVRKTIRARYNYIRHDDFYIEVDYFLSRWITFYLVDYFYRGGVLFIELDYFSLRWIVMEFDKNRLVQYVW